METNVETNIAKSVSTNSATANSTARPLSEEPSAEKEHSAGRKPSTDLAPSGQALRILMIAPQPYFTARGTPFSVMHRIRALLSAGHHVDLVTYGYGEDIELPALPGKLRVFRSKQILGIHTIRIGPSIPKVLLDLLLYWKTRAIMKTQQYDLLHSHEEAAFWAMSLCKRHNTPHLYDMHSSLPQQLSNFKAFNVRLFRKTFEHLENRVLDTCDGIITICDELAQIVAARVPHKPHKMIENIGDDSQVFSATAENVVETFALQDKAVLLYTGTFEAYQGIDLLLEALPHVKAKQDNVVAMLVGGQAAQIEAYRKMADYLGVGDIVRFSGTVHPSRIPNFVNAADIIVSPRSRGTNTPLKIYNYLRKGIPMVATDRLTHTQILNPDVSCLVDATPQSFAGGILKVLHDEQYAKRLAKQAQEFAEQHFSDREYITMVNTLVNDTMQAVAQKTKATITNPV